MLGSELVVLNPDTGAVVRRLTRADGVEGPDDVAFNANGDFYWTSILTGEVGGYKADGTRVTAAKLTAGVNPITFSDDGRLFVAQCFFGDKLYEVDPNGVKEARLISDKLGPKCGLNGMDWGPDKRLYGPRWFTGEIVSFDVDTNTMRTEATGFQVPAAVKFDSKGRLHVLDTMAGTVNRVGGGKTEVIATLSPGLDNFAFDANDRLFVSSFTDSFVVRVEPDGSLFELSPGGMATPGGVAVRSKDGHHEVVVADLQALRGFDGATGAATFVERNILGVSPIGRSLTVAPDGDLLVLSSWVDEDVRVWDPVAHKVVERHGGLGGPVDAVAFDGGVAISEHANHRVISIKGDSTTVLAEGQAHGARGRWPRPLRRRPYERAVVENRRRRICHVAAAGRGCRVGSAGGRRRRPGRLRGGRSRSRPGGSGEQGRQGRAARGHRTGLAGRFVRQPPSFVFNGIAAGDDGTLYVTGERTRTLYRIAR